MPNNEVFDRHRHILENTNRLAVLRNLALVDSKEEPFFDNLTRLITQVIGTPVSLVSMVAANYQFFKSSHGLPEPWRSQRRTPLSHSFCQHVVVSGTPLIVEDARQVDFLRDNLAIPDLNVIGYLGIPLHDGDGRQLGSLCAIDTTPRKWTGEEIELMEHFADLVNAEISARARARARSQADLQRHMESAHRHLNILLRAFSEETPRKLVIEQLREFKAVLDAL